MQKRRNSFLSSHRNISIIRVSTNVVDYCDPTLDNNRLRSSLWQEIWEHPGIDAVFGHIHTPDLGKWNLLTSDNHYPEVCAWLDQHLPAKFSMIPTNVSQKVTFEDFAKPERLSCNIPDGSVVSGLTTQSDTTAYSNRLFATFGTSNNTQTTPNAWCPPPTVDSVNYHFDPKDFPIPETIVDPATALPETAPTIISDVTHSLISQSVTDSIAKWEAKHTAQEQQAQDKLTSLQLDIQKLLQSVTADVTKQVLAAIDSYPGTTQAITKSEMDNNLGHHPSTKRIELINQIHPRQPQWHSQLWSQFSFHQNHISHSGRTLYSQQRFTRPQENKKWHHQSNGSQLRRVRSQPEIMVTYVLPPEWLSLGQQKN
jgi:hypothetical protein